jgi:hypothetical protein
LAIAFCSQPWQQGGITATFTYGPCRAPHWQTVRYCGRRDHAPVRGHPGQRHTSAAVWWLVGIIVTMMLGFMILVAV